MARRGCRRWSGLAAAERAPRRIERDLVREADIARLRAELEKRFEVGGLEEAAMRALIYIRLPEGSIDERGFSVLKLIRASRPAEKQMSLAHFKEMVRQQYLLVCLDQERAVGALPKLLGTRCRNAQDGARDAASGSRGPRRDVGRRQAPSEADRGDVRDRGHEAKQDRGGACLRSTGQARAAREIPAADQGRPGADPPSRWPSRIHATMCPCKVPSRQRDCG